MKKWEILHIPDKIPFKPDEQPTIDVFASVIEPKLTNTLVRKLNKVAPMENYRHIKRVWKKKSVEGGDFQLILILCLVGENRKELESISDDVLELINAHQLNPFITKVHKYAAISKEEWSQQCKLWPTSYHPPTYNIEGISGFNEEDAESIFHFMRMALELAKVGHCTDEEMVVNAAVIVDPSTRQVIASANDKTCQSSTSTVNNTSFECGSVEQNDIATSHQSDADAVAIKETLFSNYSLAVAENEESYTGVSCLYPWNWTEQNSVAGNAYSWHPLQHAALVAIEHASSRDRRLFPGPVDPEDQSVNQVDHTISSPNSTLAKRRKFDSTKDAKVLKACSNGDSHSEGGERPYLCTGCDIFVAWEPCTMCAMALVHQRIRRIFYAFPNRNCGALGTVYRLQGEKSLNHHYAVFRVLLPEESLET